MVDGWRVGQGIPTGLILDGEVLCGLGEFGFLVVGLVDVCIFSMHICMWEDVEVCR